MNMDAAAHVTANPTLTAPTVSASDEIMASALAVTAVVIVTAALLFGRRGKKTCQSTA